MISAGLTPAMRARRWTGTRIRSFSLSPGSRRRILDDMGILPRRCFAAFGVPATFSGRGIWWS